MTTPDAVRAHIEWLCDQGMTQRQIGNLVGVSHNVISRCSLGLRPLTPRVADQVMRISPEDAELADKRAPSPDEQIAEEYDHFVVRLGWDDTDFAALMADDLGLDPHTVMTKIRRIQRERSPVGLSRREADLLTDVGFTGELSRQTGTATRVLEERGFIETFVWRGHGHVRYAILTDAGRRALEMERTSHECQS